jgi:ACS family hexuronate transporter-like MFS transporter
MWAASFVMMVCSWLSYVDRQILATLSVVILADTGLNTERYTQVVSAFSIAYMIGNPLWGSLLDYIGLRKGMLVAVAIWSAATHDSTSRRTSSSITATCHGACRR